MPWAEYETLFNALMAEREVERHLSQESFEQPTALLCSEASAEHCHRRLALEYLADHWDGIAIVHL